MKSNSIKRVDIDFKVTKIFRYGNGASELVLTPEGGELPPISGGQFVNVLVPKSAGVMLRRPISINDVNYEKNELTLLVKNVGKGTDALCKCMPDDIVRILLPLGKGFSIPTKHKRPLLIGGGIGTAPMLYWGTCLVEIGLKPIFLLGARSSTDLLQLEKFEQLGEVEIATEDGSFGFQGLVTEHPVFQSDRYDIIYACGPMPMLKSVAALAKKRNIETEVSLENKMACGIGACLCCVENTTTGNRCTCTDGPVFNINELRWEI